MAAPVRSTIWSPYKYKECIAEGLTGFHEAGCHVDICLVRSNHLSGTLGPWVYELTMLAVRAPTMFRQS